MQTKLVVLFSTAKPGQCPRLDGVGICIRACSNDAECEGDLKCCFNGCGHTCQKPGIEQERLICRTHWKRWSRLRACQVQSGMPGSAVAVRAHARLYLAHDCCLVSGSTQRSLWSADVQTCMVPRTLSSYGNRIFAATGPRLWNSLPVQLHNPDITYGLFRQHLKGHLYGNHEHGALWFLICWHHKNSYLLTYLLNNFDLGNVSIDKLPVLHFAYYKSPFNGQGCHQGQVSESTAKAKELVVIAKVKVKDFIFT